MRLSLTSGLGSRRDSIGPLIGSGLAAGASPAVGQEELKHVVAALDDARRYVDGALVDYFRRRIASCAADDGARGPKATLPAVLGVIAAVEQMAHEVRPSVRRDLLAVAGHAAEFASWLYRDIGARDLARYWRDRAMEWAQVAGVGLEAHSVAAATNSTRTMHELARLAEGLHPWAPRATVRDLREAVLA